MGGAIRWLASILLLAAGPASAAQVRQETFGCKSLASTERLMTLQKADDRETYRDDLARLARAGECRLWQEGEPVVAKDESEDLACFAAKGSGICYWTARTLTE